MAELDLDTATLPALDGAGFRVAELRPIVDVVTPADFIWQWPATFFESGLERLLELGYFEAARAAALREAFRAAAAVPETRMITPAVLEIIAERA